MPHYYSRNIGGCDMKLKHLGDEILKIDWRSDDADNVYDTVCSLKEQYDLYEFTIDDLAKERFTFEEIANIMQVEHIHTVRSMI